MIFAHVGDRSHRYAALKVYIKSGSFAPTVGRELDVYKNLSAAKSSHRGRLNVRTILDSFKIIVPDGYHQVLVHKPLWRSLFDLQRILPTERYPEDLLKGALLHILNALDYLHSECQIIHTGIETLDHFHSRYV